MINNWLKSIFKKQEDLRLPKPLEYYENSPLKYVNSKGEETYNSFQKCIDRNKEYDPQILF